MKGKEILDQLKRKEAAYQLDEHVVSPLASRISGCFLFILLLVFWSVIIAVSALTGLAKSLPGWAGGLLFFLGFFVPIVLAGLLHNWLRRKIWSFIARRRR